MPMPLETSTKAALRAAMSSRRNALDGRAERSAAICGRLANLAIYQTAEAIHCYLPIRSEVDTLPLVRRALDEGKRVAVPVVVSDALLLDHAWLRADALEALATGAFGTMEPVAAERSDSSTCDLFIVPLLAFDRTCRRLGYGKGYYDRLLAGRTVPTIGVAFAAQEVQLLITEPHDVQLTAIVTEDEIITGIGRIQDVSS